MMTTPTATRAIIDAHYQAYGAGDVEAIAATLAPEVVIAGLNGVSWIKGRGEASTMYRTNMTDWPLSTTTEIGSMSVGSVEIRRESTVGAKPDAGTTEVLAFYSVNDGHITRLDMAPREGDESAALAAAEAQLVAYNVQDLDAHVACFADDVVVADFNGAENLKGIEAYRARMSGVFAQFPQNQVELLGRLSLGNTVCDHEKVMRSPDAEPFEVIAIYTVTDGKIVRVDFVR